MNLIIWLVYFVPAILIELACYILAPFVAVSLIIDVLNNLILFSLIFCEIPKELTVTDRLKRHYRQQTIRGKLATWIGDTLLNPFDHSGNHLD